MSTSSLPPQARFADRFQIVSEVSRGAQAHIHEALDLDQGLPGRRVALKIFHADNSRGRGWGRDGGAERAPAEARFRDRLDHESIVRVHASGRAEKVKGEGEWWHYVALEWMPGGTALDWLRRSTNAGVERWTTATRIAIDVARALKASHDEGILHLDVNPSNILLKADLRAKLGDFGIAVDARATGLRHDEPPFGTPGFASSEQAKGGPVDPRSDLYSLGATYHYLVAGTNLARDGAGPPIPPRCARIVRRATEPDPDARYQDAGAMLADLERALAFLTDPTLPAYLSWVRRNYGDLTLPVLNRKIPLDRVYTALRVDSTSIEEARRSLIARLIAAGAIPSQDEADRMTDDNLLDLIESLPRHRLREILESAPSSTGGSLTIGQAFLKHPVLVIRGGPGSGKTTIVRWLASSAAASLEKGDESFSVETRHVDPGSESIDPFNLGPPRLPIFIRAADYARHRQEMGSAALPLFEYLGKPGAARLDNAPTYGDEAGDLRGSRIPEDKLASVVRSAIIDDRAMVIIDGLDEIPSPNVRRDVRDAVQEFDRLHIDRNPEGNRLILTSRIDGYQNNRLEGRAVGLVTVEKMNRPAIVQFVRSWFGAIVSDRAEVDRLTDALTLEIFKEDRTTLLQLAGIPLLAGILLAIFFRRGRLPDTRVELFEAAVAEFLKIWDDRDLRTGRARANHRFEYIRVLESLARELHAGEGPELIQEETLVARLPKMICAERGWPDPGLDPPAQVLDAAEEMLQEIREPVGLLIPRIEGAYGFIHLTFQEYLAAKHLLRAKTVDGVFANLRPLFDSTRWRVPILMALGRFEHSCPREWPELVGLILNEDASFADLVPRGALILIAALEQDVSRRSAGLVGRIVERLLRAYSEDRAPGKFEKLRELIEGGIGRLRDFDEPATKDAIIHQIGQPTSASAAAALLRKLEWYDRDLGTALLQAREHDSSALGWPIHAALREMASPLPPPHKPWTPDVVKSRDKLGEAWAQAERTEAGTIAKSRLDAYERDHADAIADHERAVAAYESDLVEYQEAGRFRPRVDLPNDLLPLRQSLAHDPVLRDRVARDPTWLRLIVGMYGGLGEFRSVDRMREYHQFATFLELPDFSRRMFLAPLRDRWGKDDPVYAIAVHLDTTGSHWRDEGRVHPYFDPRFLAQDSPLTESLILPALRADQIEPLILALRAKREAGNASEQADATLALALLGRADDLTERRVVSEMGNWDRLQRAAAALKDPVARASGAIGSGLSSVAADAPDWEDLLRSTLATLDDLPARGGPTQDRLNVPASARPYVLAEHLVSRFLGGSDDPVKRATQALADLVDQSVPLGEFSRAIALAPRAKHPNHSIRTFSWGFEQIPPRSFGLMDIPIFVMTAMQGLDPRIVRKGLAAMGKILFPFHGSNDNLVPEFVAFVLRDMGHRSERLGVLRRLDRGLDEQDDLPGLFLKRAEGLRSPYHKARALLRFLPLFPDQRDRLMALARDAIRAIRDPHLREQTFEKFLAERPAPAEARSSMPRPGWFRRLFGRSSHRDRTSSLKEALRAARAVRNRDDRARALARLAFHVPPAERAKLLGEALDAAASIRARRDRLETLELIYPQLAGHPDLRSRARRAAGLGDGLRAGWDRAAGPLRVALPRLFERAPADLASWATIAAAAEIHDHLLPDPDRGPTDILWAEVADGPGSEAVAILLRRAEVEGLVMTRAAALVIDGLAPESLDRVKPLIPYLQSAEPETLPILADWLLHRDDPLRTQAALLLAEREGLTEDVVAHVLTCLKSHDDLIRARACNVVHHPSIIPDKESGPTRAASVLGQPVLSALAQQALTDTSEVTPRFSRATWINWCQHDLTHDSPAIFENLIEAIRRDPGAGLSVLGRLSVHPDPARPGRVAEHLLSGVEGVTPTSWPVLLDGLRRGPMPVRTAVLTSLIRLVSKVPLDLGDSRMTAERWGQFVQVIDGLALEELPPLDVLVHDIPALIRAAVVAAQGPNDPRGRVEAARADLFQTSRYRLPELLKAPPDPKLANDSKWSEVPWVAGLAAGDPRPDAIRRPAWFALIAASQLYADDDPSRYLEPSPEVTKQISECPEALDVLREWLKAELSTGRPEGPLSRLCPDLMVATAQAVAVKPRYFEAHRDQDEVRRLLVRATTYQPHRTARSAAIVLLGRMETATLDLLPAMRSALLDVDDVRNGAMMAAETFRRCSTGLLSALVGAPGSRDGLYHPSAVVAFGFATLLEALGRSDEVSETDRLRILPALAGAIQHPSTDRVVHFGYTGSRLHDPPKLNQLLYRVLLRVAGVEPLARSEGTPLS